MKAFEIIVKLTTALVAIAGAIYVVATYGDKIVAWAKSLMPSCPCNSDTQEAPAEEVPAQEAPAAEEAPASEPVEEEAPVEEAPVEEAPAAEEVVPVADESDFVG